MSETAADILIDRLIAFNCSPVFQSAHLHRAPFTVGASPERRPRVTEKRAPRKGRCFVASHEGRRPCAFFPLTRCRRPPGLLLITS
jgi:hypothetical protein